MYHVNKRVCCMLYVENQQQQKNQVAVPEDDTFLVRDSSFVSNWQLNTRKLGRLSQH